MSNLPDFPDFYFDGEFSAPFDGYHGSYADLEMVLRMFWGVMVAVLVVSLLFCIVFLVFQGLGLMRLAKRKGIPNGWMGFVPVLNLYTLGKVSNTPDSRKRPEIALIILGALTALFTVICLVNLVPFMDIAFRAGAEGRFYYSNDLPEMLWGMMGMAALTGVAAGGLSIAQLVLMFIALHRVYKQFAPNNASVMTVFTVIAYSIFGIPIHPFMLFAIRNNPSAFAPDAGFGAPPSAPPPAPAEPPSLKPPAQGFASTHEPTTQGYTAPLEPPAQGYATSLDPPPAPSVKTPEPSDEE